MNLRNFQNALADVKLNPYIDISNPDKVLIHFVEEVGEFVKAFRRNNIENMSEELGDLLILLAFLSESVNVDLEQAVTDKLRTNIENKKFFGKIEDFSGGFNEQGELKSPR